MKPCLLNLAVHPARASKLQTHAGGFSLVELLIAIFITLFLVAGMLGIIVSMRGSFSTQDQLERIQENERFALTVLDNTIRDAGFFSNPTTTTSATAFPATSTANPDSTTFVATQGISGTTGSGSASDTVNVRFQTDSGDGLMNCLGDTNTSGAAVTWTNSFGINASNQLVCAVSTNGGAPGTAVVLVDNVASMKVLYGVDTNADGSADEYVASSAIGATPAWTDVSSVRLQITFQDLINSKTGAPVSLPVLTHNISLMNRP
jgi:type IV pilus assembly protein PilW